MKFSVFIVILSGILFSCSGNKEQRDREIKEEQYFIEGKKLFLSHCSMCHQKEGQGLAELYPPLNKSDFMDNHLDEVICLIRHGRTDPLVVNGITYTQPMPGFPNLTNLEVAQIATFIYNSWEHDEGLIDVKNVEEVMDSCYK